ncbi:hypothetical protein EJ110_NYTH52446 [Nymphaea thermarum]|nr:hypothetical protein EJ110_NYTH52446 [Nymphaea thermarum]
MMMEICRNLHAFLGRSEEVKRAGLGGDDDGREGGGGGGGGDCGPMPLPCQVHHRTKDGFPASSGLTVVAQEVHKPRNVLESCALKPPALPSRMSSAPSPMSSAPSRLALAARVCHDEEGSGRHNCTEGLGFESSDESEVASGDGSSEVVDVSGQAYLEKRTRRKMMSRMRCRAELPPPLPWLNGEGRPRFFLRQERRDGRMLLTEMRAGPRREIFVAERRDGRLMLHLVGKPLPRKEKEEFKKQEENVEQLEEGEKEEKGGEGGAAGNVEVVRGGQKEERRLLGMVGGGSWRCCDEGRGELEDFWNHQYVMST